MQTIKRVKTVGWVERLRNPSSLFRSFVIDPVSQRTFDLHFTMGFASALPILLLNHCAGRQDLIDKSATNNSSRIASIRRNGNQQFGELLPDMSSQEMTWNVVGRLSASS